MDKTIYLQLAAPLEGADPAGVDAKEFDEFDKLTEEVDKVQGLSFVAIDWAKVEQYSVKILAEQSKDLRVAGYLMIALYQQHGFEGLVTGMQLFSDIVNADYWDSLFPQRRKRQNKARAVGFAWPIKRLEAMLAAYEVTKDSEFDQLVATAKAFAQLDNAVYARLEDDIPNSGEVKKRLERISLEAQSWIDKAEPVVPPPVKKETKPESKPQSGVTEAIKHAAESVKNFIIPKAEAISKVSKEDVDKALLTSSQTMASVVTALRGESPYDPWAFYLARTAKWMTLKETPPNAIMPPNPQPPQMDALEAMAANKQYPALIDEIEKLFMGGAIFNMALHRMVANALDAVGASEAADMVKLCLGDLLKRFPDLVGRTFKDQQGFVDDLTQTWIESSGVMVHSSSTANVSDDTGGSSQSNTDVGTLPWIEGLAQAKALLVKGDFEAGVKVLATGISQAAGLREQTFWQVTQARFCDSAGHTELALLQLQQLEALVNDTVMAQWEPQLRLDIITTLLQCHVKNMAKTTYTPEQKQALKPLHSELSLKDPVTALSIIIK
ncbi:MAG: type VI secretion system protein TssA [Algicola sp.]|nr:type VI secretion system protein TssA [Algicola sp.]